MAINEHMYLIRQGVDVWNKWRQIHPTEKPDLSEAYLWYAKLSRVNLKRADLRKAKLWNVDLSQADLREAMLQESSLGHGDLIRADLRGANLRGADLSEADLRGADLSRADLTEADLSEAKLANADLSNANLQRADFSKTDLFAAKLWNADLKDTDFGQADLSKARISNADLKDSSLIGARLWGADLSNSDLSRADFQKSDLVHADLSNANLSGTHLGGCQLGWSIIGDVNLRKAKGLESVHHVGPSTIGVDTIYRSGGLIPESFLRGAGVPEYFIIHSASLVEQKILFFSCFICHGQADRVFAEMLAADLGKRGVRCWLAPEIENFSGTIRHKVDQSKRLRDKMILILSEHSMHGKWVQNEVEAALEEEKRRNKPVLHVVRLGPVDLFKDVPWASRLLKTRYVGDFSQWRNPSAHEKQLELLYTEIAPGADLPMS